MAYNSTLSKVQVLNVILLSITLVCVIVTSWKSIRKSRETQDRNYLFRRDVFDYTSTAVLDDLVTRIRYYYLTFFFLALITIPLMIVMSFYRNWKAFLIATSIFTFIWLIKLVIFLNSNEEYYNWISTFSPMGNINFKREKLLLYLLVSYPVGEYLSQFFNALSCINSFILVNFLRKKELESKWCT